MSKPADLTGFHRPEDLGDADIKFANCLTLGKRRKDMRNYQMQNLYHWSSKSLGAHSEGDIIVMAENVEQARDKVLSLFNPLEDGGPFENSYLQILYFNEDPDYEIELDEELQVLKADLNKEPTIVSSDVVCIRGSD